LYIQFLNFAVYIDEVIFRANNKISEHNCENYHAEGLLKLRIRFAILVRVSLRCKHKFLTPNHEVYVY